MGLIAEGGAARMQARQNYRTMARMQRRRSFVQDKLGAKEDFANRQQQPAQAAAPAPLPHPSRSTWGSWSGSPSSATRAS